MVMVLVVEEVGQARTPSCPPPHPSHVKCTFLCSPSMMKRSLHDDQFLKKVEHLAAWLSSLVLWSKRWSPLPLPLPSSSIPNALTCVAHYKLSFTA